MDVLLRSIQTINTGVKDGSVDGMSGGVAQDVLLNMTMAKLGVSDFSDMVESATAQVPPPPDIAQDEAEAGAAAVELLKVMAKNIREGKVTPETVSEFISETYGE